MEGAIDGKGGIPVLVGVEGAIVSLCACGDVVHFGHIEAVLSFMSMYKITCGQNQSSKGGSAPDC